MPRRIVAATAALAIMFSTPVLAQSESGGASSGGAASGGAASAPEGALTPNAPLQAPPDESPVPAGTAAGVGTAAAWSPGPVTIAVGVAAVAAAVCLAVCGGSSTSSTTKTTK
ncbi:MAG TPA: hypothetical protein VGL35_13220 [Rhizomicrobium sp.]